MRWVIMLLALLLVTFPASAQGSLGIQRHAIVSGGPASGRLIGAIGQPVAGTIKTSSATLCSGFWCGFRTNSGAHIIPPSGTLVQIVYRMTFGKLSETLAASMLIALVVTRRAYNTMRKIWSKS